MAIPRPARQRRDRPHLPANIALAMVSAAIAATLFLVVLLLIEGWRLTPIEAAIVVTVMPLAALVGAASGSSVPSERMRGRGRRDPPRRRPRRPGAAAEGLGGST